MAHADTGMGTRTACELGALRQQLDCTREGRDIPALSFASRSMYYKCRLEFFAGDHCFCRRSILFTLEDSGVFACFVRYFGFPIDEGIEKAFDK